MTPKVAVVYHSRRGTMRALAESAAEGARAYGAQVRLLRVPDDKAITAWPDPEAAPEDALWADGLVLASPTYFGTPSSPFKRFLESTSPLWSQGLLADRIVTGLTASTCLHGGRETTLLALYQSVYHWGAWALGADPAGTDCEVTGGNPYGLAVTSVRDGVVGEADLAAAWSAGHRLAATAAQVRRSGREDGAAGRARVTVVHCSEDETVRMLAQECAAGARETGAEVRLRRLAGPAAARESGLPGPAGGAPPAAVVTPDDVDWADSLLFGARIRSGALAASLLGFLQSLEPESGPGPLAGKPAGGFACAPRPQAGSESAMLALNNVLHHGGAVLVPPGYTDPAVFAAGGNPYGTTHSRTAGALPTAQALAAARHQGRRMALAGGRLRREPVGAAVSSDTPLAKEVI
ncbi:flavodoxin family protein [Streptomyces nondiastaticus]|uniref:flavodoxin family protein n=1 Tax=Streptomyces TaxID=1883 RepID=UPI0026770B65|nr:flavodoxin family protein [Streptomyces sp. VNUA116]WKU48426.1 flavodoxin family protein [Streptomyces sp. VNUA116]